jgi:carboxypeptidase C (cathepsin A)
MEMRSVLVIAAFALATAGAATAQANPPQQQPSQQPPAQQPNRTEQPNREQPSRSEQQRPSSSQMTVPEAQRPPQQQRERARPGEPQGEGQPHRGPAPEEKTSVTHHTARIGGQQINYTATAATYVIRADDGSPKATMFYVAYTKDGVDASRRPISFVYNGGPGSASLFTHMGMGPKRVVLTADGHGMPAPYSVVDNEDSFLDATDLVFIDAISTGYSRPAPGESPAQFHGIIEDANWFADFIYQYITRNERWLSPKFLIGESYGTTRSAELSGVLQERHEIYLNGIVLVSTVAFANWGADDRSEFFLPTYVTTAWYHRLLQPDLQNLTIEQVAEKARIFAHGDYAAALAKGDTLTPEEHKKIVDEIAHYTALSPKYIEESNLRVVPRTGARQAPHRRPPGFTLYRHGAGRSGRAPGL